MKEISWSDYRNSVRTADNEDMLRDEFRVCKRLLFKNIENKDESVYYLECLRIVCEECKRREIELDI